MRIDIREIAKGALRGLLIGLTIKFLLDLLGYQIVPVAKGAELSLFKPSEVSLEAEKYDNLRDPYISEYTDQWTYGAALGTKFDLLSVKSSANQFRLFYEPTLKFRATESQIRQGGLYYEGGLSIAGTERTVSIFRRHESLHCLECKEQSGGNKQYPVLDSWVAQFKFKIK